MSLLHRFFAVVLLPAASAAPLPEATVAQAAAHIDQLLAKDLTKAELKPNAGIDDPTFLRRAYLGIVGRIPSYEETRSFLESKSPEKRTELVDRLVASPGFDSHLFNWSADLLRVQTNQEQFGLGWHVWLRRSLAEDKPWDEMVGDMLGATGHCVSDPAVGYFLRDRNMQLDNFSNSMQVFLGRQIGCAQCHDHPFDDWSQYDYYQMAAFGGGIQYRSSEAQETIRNTVNELNAKPQPDPEPAKPSASSFAPPNNKKKNQAKRKNKSAQQGAQKLKREQEQLNRKLAKQLSPLFRDFNKNAIYENERTKLKLPADYAYKDAKPGDAVPAATLFGEKVTDVAPEDRQQAFAKWVTSPDNPYFTQVIANRLWARTFGRGLVDPVDDWSDDSETLHQEVLSYLETTMKGCDYDLRQFLRVLFHTKLFQRECLVEEPAMGVPLAFRGPVLRRMSAEQIYDSFLVLNRGEINDAPTNKFNQSWDAYREQVTNLLDAAPQELLILAESAQQGADLQREAQARVRSAQKALASAEDPAARRKAQQLVQEARKDNVAARQQADPLRYMQQRRSGKRENKGALRSSEMPAPFRPGTLVREFGGSDRLTPSSSEETATVPQALAMLNDSKTDIVGSKRSQLGRALAKIDSPQERLDYLFMTLLSRHPDAGESDRFLPFTKDEISTRDLTRAILTSNRFLFIQ